jgi:hypothetical protein
VIVDPKECGLPKRAALQSSAERLRSAAHLLTYAPVKGFHAHDVSTAFHIIGRVARETRATDVLGPELQDDLLASLSVARAPLDFDTLAPMSGRDFNQALDGFEAAAFLVFYMAKPHASRAPRYDFKRREALAHLRIAQNTFHNLSLEQELAGEEAERTASRAATIEALRRICA